MRAEALARLADELSAPRAAVPDPGPRPEPQRGKLTPESVAATLSALLPEQAVITDEAVTFGRGFFPFTYAAEPHDWLNSTGGAIGCGPPLATGAAVGAPGRRVIALQADGSAMYTLQALWTQAREKLDVTTVLLSNRKYQILLGELANVGANPGRTALDMLDLGNPDLDWTKLAAGMGVEADARGDLRTLRRSVRSGECAQGAVPDRTDDLILQTDNTAAKRSSRPDIRCNGPQCPMTKSDISQYGAARL